MRAQIYDYLKKELIGPDPIHPYVQDNGEEILINEPPRLRYGAGILFPQTASYQNIEVTDQTEDQLITESTESLYGEEDTSDIQDRQEFMVNTEDSNDSNDEIINLANNYLPSVIGYSCFVRIPDEGFVVYIKAGRYKKRDYIENTENRKVVKPAYYRESLDTRLEIKRENLPNKSLRSQHIEVLKDGHKTGLEFNITNRSNESYDNTIPQLFTFSLVNNQQSSKGHIDNEDCFFQVEFSVEAINGDACFLPYPESATESNIEDEESNQLLYRNYKTYAVGHGCAPLWENEKEGVIARITADVLPLHEMKPIVPMQFEDIQLTIFDMTDKANQAELTKSLDDLCDEYEKWINRQLKLAEEELPNTFQSTVNSHIQNCRDCLGRMRKGVDLIRDNNDIRRAFGLMNNAMLSQQIHYSLKLREWDYKDGNLTIDKYIEPRIDEPKSWPDWSPPENRNTKFGSWYPFQIAFILMNLKSITDPLSAERNIVDLIWFPTGGGKTEAYLGLAAFTIFYRRIKKTDDAGTSVIMRYTLRLLTAQQYQRAASLICACELLRKQNESELGNERISIGLWVGSGLTSNTRSDALKALNKLSKGESKENPFIILKCPWCGAKMGPVYAGRFRVIGYRKIKQPSTVIFQCHDPNCAFSHDDFSLPLQVIDEDIYQKPDSIIIGTVDKFAMLPWRPEARTIFGYRGNSRISPPELIIQDELHLISGPLGSMTGHYETFIQELCKRITHDNQAVKPKIIASTATITRATNQIHSLFGCGRENVSIFPAQCIEAGDSYFAHIDTQYPGRMYLGVHASGLPSHTTTQVRVLSALLQSVKSVEVENENQRDPYWTNMVYFNSLRELGHAATLLRADIREYLNALWMRKGITKQSPIDPRRFINKAIELTSRISSTEIPEQLQSLEINYPINENSIPVDVCLATNMISVGVDVQRLGLMTVIGQPKTTSEYIQATSRVGRSNDKPGLVVTIYNTAKPRDRSHYEHFYSYHSSIYKQVEPTSITPFSAPVRERALHAILVGLVRFLGKEENRSSPQPLPEEDLFKQIKNIIGERVILIDPDEKELTLNLLNERIDEWSRFLPPIYGGFFNQSGDLPLMYPAGTTPLDDWDMKSWATPTSMRNVDASCDAKVISNYITSEGDNDAT